MFILFCIKNTIKYKNYLTKYFFLIFLQAVDRLCLIWFYGVKLRMGLGNLQGMKNKCIFVVSKTILFIYQYCLFQATKPQYIEKGENYFKGVIMEPDIFIRYDDCRHTYSCRAENHRKRCGKHGWREARHKS